MNRLRVGESTTNILNRLKTLILKCLLLTARILLLLCLDLRSLLLLEKKILVCLVLLVLAHELVEFLRRILHLGHHVLTRIPRNPTTNLTKEKVITRILALEDLRHHLRLLKIRKDTADLHTTNIRAELDLLCLLRLKILLILHEECCILIENVRLADLLVVNLRKLLKILEKILDLERVLLGKESVVRLHTLDLPILLKPLDELLIEETILLPNDLLGGKERDESLTLCRDLRVLLEIINYIADLILLGELFSHFEVLYNPP